MYRLLRGHRRCPNRSSLFAILAVLWLPTTAWAQPSSTASLGANTSTLNQLPIRFEPADQKGTLFARAIGSTVRLSGRSIDFPMRTDLQPHGSIRVEFVDARSTSRVIGLDPLPGRVNYLYGDDSTRWRTNVPTYARARTKNLYRGIDVLYYGAGDQLEYDLVVRPGAQPDSIRLAISGALVAITADGDLANEADHHVLLHKPIAYQTIAGVRHEVAVNYRRREDGTIGFAVGPHDRRQILVIDPVVAYSFSFGGSGDEQVYDIAVDDTGAVYVGGETYSGDFPTVNPAQPRDDAGEPCTFYGASICRDAFLAKLAPDGQSLEYATYFGSDDFDQVNHIVVDSSHALYFAGWTTTQTTNVQPDVRNSFIGKLAPDGSHFVYTYYTPRCCATGPQLTINDLAVASDGSAYVAVSTPSTAEIATLSPAGDNLHSIYTLTDPSGVSRTSFNAIAVHGDSVFVGGNTTWPGFPTTAYTFSGSRNGVVMRLSLTGSVIYSVFVNLRNAITIADLAVNGNVGVQVVGDGSSTDAPCSPSSSTTHEVIVARVTNDGFVGDPNGFLAFAAFPYPSNACLLPPARIDVDDQGSAFTAACGYGPPGDGSRARAICNLFRITPALGVQASFDVPGRQFTIDRNGIGRWFAPITGQVSIIKLTAQVSFQSLTATPSVAQFGTEILFRAVIPTAEDDVEASFWRYDTYGGWRQVHEFTSPGRPDLFISYGWTPAWWDAGDHQVCVFVRLVGSSDQPQSACTSVTVLGLSANQPPILPLAADFNADLRPDLLWIHDATGELAMWNMGGGEHGERLLNGGYLSAPPLPAGWRVAGSADIDGDGQTDLVLQSDTGYVGAWFFNGSTMTGGALLSPSQVDPNWQIRAVGDLNHDGHPDLIWQYAPTGQVAFWLMNGTNATGYVIPNVPPPGSDWEIIGTGDSNRDGERDIFWQQRSTGALAVWLMMNGTELASGSVLSANPGSQWRAVAVTDLDGDAYSDIVLQNTNTGDLGAWYLNGNRVKFGVILVPSSVGATGWSIVGPR